MNNIINQKPSAFLYLFKKSPPLLPTAHLITAPTVQQQYRRITKGNVIRTTHSPLKSCFFKTPQKPPKSKDFPIFHPPKSTSRFFTRPSPHLHFSSDTLTAEYHQYRTTTTPPLLHLQHAIDGSFLSIHQKAPPLEFNNLFPPKT